MSDVTLHVVFPDTVPTPTARLTFDPKTVDEFDRIVDACGGVLALDRCDDFLHGDIPGGRVTIHFPTEIAPQPAVSARGQFGLDFDARKRHATDALEAIR